MEGKRVHALDSVIVFWVGEQVTVKSVELHKKTVASLTSVKGRIH